MKKVHIILASASPRRKELLSRLGWTFDVMPSNAKETHFQDEAPSDMVMRLSRLKGENVASEHPQSLVISSDTAVFCDKEVFGKPKDASHAMAMLKHLSGKTHQVYSGLAIFWHGNCRCAYESTDVTFRPLSDDDILGYIATHEGDGCAGAYAIQGKGSVLIKGISGDYSNVVGLPMPLLAEMMETLGFSISEIIN